MSINCCENIQFKILVEEWKIYNLLLSDGRSFFQNVAKTKFSRFIIGLLKFNTALMKNKLVCNYISIG